MTKDVIELAREAGMKFAPAQFSGVLETETDEFTIASFAALVAARERERIAEMAQCTVWAGREFADRIRALNTEGDVNDKQPASD